MTYRAYSTWFHYSLEGIVWLFDLFDGYKGY